MKISNTFFNGYFKQKNAETGRSMVEILGVLAIIGVLSIGGIYGYTFAMDKYRANDIVYEVNLRATDVWHKYQEQPLPDPSEDGTDFDEFPDMTGTGYPIYMTTHPDVAFKTYVEGVSSRVCKNVVNMNLNGIVKGIQFVQVNGTKYTGNASICGEDETDNTIVFTSFLDSENNEAGTGQSGDPCVEDTDCMSACGNATCDTDKMICQNSCTGTDTPYCLDNGEDGICVECLVNEDCKSKGRGYICDESNHTCSALQKSCPEGTFRSQNGACISCGDGSNFIVLKDGQGFPDTSDEVDGFTMCQQCEESDAKRWYGELVDDTAHGYCSYMCTEGYSYQSSTEGCIPCSDMTAHKIQNESISKNQCSACPNLEWYTSYVGGSSYWCQAPLECKSDEYIYLQWGGDSRYHCISCFDTGNRRITSGTSSSIPNFAQSLSDKCNNCPERDENGQWSKRWAVREFCLEVCQQPENAEEQIAICQANPKDERCTRKWQSAYSGKCYDCDVINIGRETELLFGYDNDVSPELRDLCEKCGRKVNEKGYCVPKDGSACPLGQIMGANGDCKPCPKISDTGITIINDEESGCTKNCRMKDGKYSSDSDAVDTTWIHNTTRCAPKCPADMWQDSGSLKCHNCNVRTTGLYDPYGWLSTEECEDKCPNLPYKRAKGDNAFAGSGCFLVSCGSASDGTVLFTVRAGGCVKCTESASFYPVKFSGVNECSLCHNRMMIGEYCVLIAGGQSGVCNDKENDFSSWVSDEVKNNVQPWLDGLHNGEKFRDNEGYCHSCDTDTSYKSTQAQCATCKNRRYENGICLKGLCSEGKQFLNTNATCVACSKKNIAVHPNITNLCSSCENRRMLTTGFEEQGNWTGLCVEECVGDLFQKVNGECVSCSTSGTFEIGTDAESIRLCNTCEGRKAIPVITGDDIRAYQCIEE